MWTIITYIIRSFNILKDINIIFGITGAFSAFPTILPKIKELKTLGANIYPIMSYYAYNLNTRFLDKEKYINQIEDISENVIIHNMSDVELFFKKIKSDVMIVAPTTGNTLAKLANSISDTTVTFASKQHLKNKKPLVLSINAIDGLSSNACNIGTLLNRKHIFIVPFRQANPITKPYSISSDNELLVKTTLLSLENEQLEPLLI